MKDIVFTGMGCITPAGSGADDMVKAVDEFKNTTADLKENRMRKMQDEEADRIKTLGSFPRLDRGIAYLLTAVSQALKNSNIELEEMNRKRIGIVIGTTFGMWSSQVRFLKAYQKTSKPSSVLFQQTTNNLYSGALAYQYQLSGHNVTLFSNWTGGIDAILYAKRLIAQDCCDTVIVGAIDTIDETSGICCRNIKSSAADGKVLDDDFVLGEAVSVVIMESDSLASRLGHPILGSFVEGAHSRFYSADEISLFLSARVLNGDFDTYMANTNHTFVDSAESRALNICKGKTEAVYIKHAIGECGAASGGLQVIYGLKKHIRSVVFNACITGKMGYLRIAAE